jgi:hypothetical protein
MGRYETGKAPVITITDCQGDVVLKGWPELAVAVKGDHIVASKDPDVIELQGSGSIKVMVPTQANVMLQRVAGNLVVKGIDGGLQVGEVHGSVALKNGNKLEAASIGGDLAVRNLNGPLTVQQVMGDTALRNVAAATLNSAQGDVAIRYVEGKVQIAEAMGDVSLHTVNEQVTIDSAQRDVNLSNLGGKLMIQGVRGDIRLKGGLAAGKHHCSAQGDIVVRWPVKEPLNVLITASSVQNRLDLEDVVQENNQFSGRIGDGETQLILDAGGTVILKSSGDPEWDVEYGSEWAAVGAEFAGLGNELAGLGQQISSEIGAHMAELSARMEEHLGSEFAQKMADRAAKRTERAMQRAMRQANRARSQTTTWTAPPPPPKAKKSEGPSAEEQTKILSMLEKGIISVEEAENLLKALEE